jgi:glycine cleavage system aminomethyltransferase T
VGLAHRSDLAVLSLAGPAGDLDRFLHRRFDHSIQPCGAALENDVWWCRGASPSAITVICAYARAERVAASLRKPVGAFPRCTAHDLSESTCVLNVIGRQTERVLADLGVLGATRDPRDVGPFTQAPVNGHRVTWLLESSTSALALVEVDGTVHVWQAVETAGRRYGMCCVGVDAVTRYRVSERIARGNSRVR